MLGLLECNIPHRAGALKNMPGHGRGFEPTTLSGILAQCSFLLSILRGQVFGFVSCAISRNLSLVPSIISVI